MKNTSKALAAAAALMSAGSAFAIDAGTVPASNRLNVSGATATNQALYQLTILASGGLCDTSDIDVYIDTAGGTDATDANDQFMVACNGRAGTPFAGQPILLTKESNGGSNLGTRNVARSTPLAFLNPTAPNCTANINVAAAGSRAAYTLFTGCTGTINAVPDAGVADVEAALFLDSTAADIATLTANPLFQIIFAPAASLNLYRALQASQGLAQDDDPANVPNLTRGQITRIFNGESFTWDEFSNPDGTPFLAGEDVYVCRRGNDSGTQASFASFFLNERCNVSVPGFVPPDTISCQAGGCDWDRGTFGGDFIFAADGSSDVRACLDSRNDNGEFALGVLSTNTSVNNTDRQIRFVGVDGAAPTLQETANGGYHFVTENVLNVRGAGPSGVPGDIVSFIVDNIGTPSVVADLNDGSRNPGGDHGILAVPNGSTIVENAPPVSIATMRTNPVSTFSRSVSGATNNCQPQSATLGGQVIGGNL